MQERRTIIRTQHTCRMQYCPAEDLELRDGRLVNVSERGVGLLAREQHRNGELVTIGFSLPGDGETLTATGTVRWSDPPNRQGRWHSIGLEWLPLEDTTRQRLQQFLDHSARASIPPLERRSFASLAWDILSKLLIVMGVIGALFAAFFLYLWIRSLQLENHQLERVVEQRDTVIEQLEQEETRLTFELETSRTHLADTTAEVARLDQQAQSIGQEAERLSQDVGRFQQSYLQVREEREQLMQRVLDLEQERAELAKRLSSIETLRLAIREAIEMRKEAQQEQRLLVLKARRAADDQRLAVGNKGYLVRDGRSTVGGSTVFIRVHEPEASE